MKTDFFILCTVKNKLVPRDVTMDAQKVGIQHADPHRLISIETDVPLGPWNGTPLQQTDTNRQLS